jgi:hypothetical protein
MTNSPAEAAIAPATHPDDSPAASLPSRVFAQRLVAAMRAKGWNQAETARQVLARLPPGANLSHYIHGRSAPRRVIRQILVRILDLDAQPAPPSGGPAGAESGVPPLASNVHVVDLHDGTVRLIVNDRVPWPTAIRVLRALLLNDGMPADRDEEPR